MALLGQVFQPLGLPHKTDRPLVPEGDNGPEFLPYSTTQSDPPPKPDKKRGVLGSIPLLGDYRLGGYVKR
jgi:hypothetical protein